MPILYRNVNGVYQIGYSNVLLPTPVNVLITQKLLGYYPFNTDILDYNDNSGTGVNDLTTFTTFPSATATIASADSYSAGKGYLNIAAGAPEFYLYRNVTFSVPISVSCWFKINYTDYSSRSNSLNYVRLFHFSGKFGIWFVDNGNGTAGLNFYTLLNGETGGQTVRGLTTGNVADNNWHNLVFVINSDFTLTIYLDNALALTFTFSNSPTALTSTSGLTNTTSSMTLLRYPGNGTFYYWGSIASYRFYSKALTNNEINYIYANKV